MENYVRQESVVRQIWGKSDVILFIFAASAAEFAVNKAVDWLFFTGRLPADPLGRLFSTVTYARNIVFSDQSTSEKVIDRMASIHRDVETKRGYEIPGWAYRDVLFMLIDYSIRAYELLYAELTRADKAEVYDVFRRVGERMGVKELPIDYESWTIARTEHMQQNLENSAFTMKLFAQYKLHLGPIRYRVLLLSQSMVVAQRVRELLGLKTFYLGAVIVQAYKILRRFKLDYLPRRIILPRKYFQQVQALDVV